MIKHEVEVTLEKYNRLFDLRIDWLIQSFKTKDEDKQIARLYYKKYKKKCIEMLDRMMKL